MGSDRSFEERRRVDQAHFRSRVALGAMILWSLTATWHASAAGQLTADAVRAIVQKANGGKVELSSVDMAGDNLTDLDLSGANLKSANLSGANLHGVKLVGADLTDANLSKADLTFAWIIKAKFDGANLAGSTLQTMVTSTGMDNTAAQADSFADANLSDVHATVHFSFDTMHGVNFSNAHMSVVIANQSMGLLRTEFMSCELEEANFQNAGLAHNLFRFARLHNANFKGADLTDADFTGAYLDGADFTGARLDGAIFDSAKLNGAKGIKK